MAADIFTLLSDYVIGKYIIDDIGTQYYQNIGFRYGFGPVILDFPFIFLTLLDDKVKIQFFIY